VRPFAQSLEAGQIRPHTPNCLLQTIVKEQLTCKVFWNRDLAGRDSRPDLGGSGGMTLRCECARVQCVLFMATVKVVRHIDGNFVVENDATLCRAYSDADGINSGSSRTCISGVQEKSRDSGACRHFRHSNRLTSPLGKPRLEVDLYRPIPNMGASRLRRRCLRPRGMPGCTHP
jgi:hypothetical protein